MHLFTCLTFFHLLFLRMDYSCPLENVSVSLKLEPITKRPFSNFYIRFLTSNLQKFAVGYILSKQIPLSLKSLITTKLCALDDWPSDLPCLVLHKKPKIHLPSFHDPLPSSCNSEQFSTEGRPRPAVSSLKKW